MSQRGSVDSLDGSDSGCSLGWECIDSADITETASQSQADPQAEAPLRDQIFAHCPERLPSSDDGFCLVASEGTLPVAHHLTETPTPTLSSEVTPEVTPLKALLEVPIECSPPPNTHSVEHDTAEVTAATAGVAELSLGPQDMLNDQAEASLDTVPVAPAEPKTTMKPSHIPASLPGLGTKRAAPQGALRPLRTRLNPNYTSLQNAETKVKTPPATLGGYPPSETRARSTFISSINAYSQQQLCTAAAADPYSSRTQYQHLQAAALSSSFFSSPSHRQQHQNQYQDQQHDSSGPPHVYQQYDDNERHLHEELNLGRPPLQRQEGPAGGSDLCDYTSAQMWDHLEHVTSPRVNTAQHAHQQQQPLQRKNIQEGNSCELQQQKLLLSLQLLQQHRQHGHSAVQQGSPGMSQLRQRRRQQQLQQQQQHLLHGGCCTQHCAGELQQWHPFVDSHQQQQQQQQGGEATYSQQQSVAALQHQNAMLQNQQKQLQQEIASLKSEKGWPDNISWPQADASRGQASSLTGREAFHNLQDSNATATAAVAQRARERYARENYAREVEQEEERMLQAALKASLEPSTQPAAQEHWQKDNMMVSQEDAVITKLQRRTAESLPIRHGTGVVWQNDPNSNSSETGNKFSDGSAAASAWLSNMCPETHDSSARIGTLRAAETLHQFAKRHFCDVKATAAINGLQTKLDDVAAVPVLYPGQILQLPCKDSCVEVGTSARLGAQVAKVGEAETIEALAEQHGVYVSSVLAVNGLPANPVVRCGQMLQMP